MMSHEHRPPFYTFRHPFYHKQVNFHLFCLFQDTFYHSSIIVTFNIECFPSGRGDPGSNPCEGMCFFRDGELSITRVDGYIVTINKT